MVSIILLRGPTLCSLQSTDEIEDSPDWFADIDVDELPCDEELFNSLSHSRNTGYNSSGIKCIVTFIRNFDFVAIRNTFPCDFIYS